MRGVISSVVHRLLRLPKKVLLVLLLWLLQGQSFPDRTQTNRGMFPPSLTCPLGCLINERVLKGAFSLQLGKREIRKHEKCVKVKQRGGGFSQTMPFIWIGRKRGRKCSCRCAYHACLLRHASVKITSNHAWFRIFGIWACWMEALLFFISKYTLIFYAEQWEPILPSSNKLELFPIVACNFMI